MVFLLIFFGIKLEHVSVTSVHCPSYFGMTVIWFNINYDVKTWKRTPWKKSYILVLQ